MNCMLSVVLTFFQVGFMAAVIADDGDTIVTKAARVKPEFGGRGCYKKLIQYAITAANARGISFTCDNTNKAIGSGSFQRQYTTVLSRVSAVTVLCGIKVVRQIKTMF